MKSLLRARMLLSYALLVLNVSAAPESWKAEISRLTANDAANPPPAHGVVFVGSSSIKLWSSLARDFPGVATVNRGFGGSELADSVFYADSIVIPYQPRLVVLYAGDNDIWSGKTAGTVAADFMAFRTKVHAALPDTKIIYLAIKPSPSRARLWEQAQHTNRLIAADCAANAYCTYVDVATPLLDATGNTRPELYRDDQLHLKPAGYAIWTKVLAPYLQP